MIGFVIFYYLVQLSLKLSLIVFLRYACILAKELGGCKTKLKQFLKKTCFPRMFSLDKITKVATCTSLHNQTFLRPMCLK